MVDDDKLQWRTSRHCDTVHCVEVAVTDDGVLVRQSGDPEGPRLSFSRAEWTVFTQAVTDGEFDHA